jgi:hypothetical protein
MGKFPFRSKTFWSGVGIILISVGSVLKTWEIKPADIQMFLFGLGLIGLRDAIEQLFEEEE